VSVGPEEMRFSLVQDPWLRLQRLLRLAPREGLGARRRAVFFALLGWLPLVVWAGATGRLQNGSDPESLWRHLGVHVRCLLAIPLFVLSEPWSDRILGIIVGNFVPSGLVRPEEQAHLAGALRSVERWRDSRWIWTLLAAIVVLVIASSPWQGAVDDVVAWARTPEGVGFGGTWLFFVTRPLFLFMAILWLWRLLLTWLLCRRLAALDLQLVPSHPDRAGGLGFTEQLPLAFTLVVLAFSSVVASSVAHQILSHGAHVMQFKALAAGLVVLLTVLFVSPLTAFSGPLRRTRLRARFEYGALAGKQVRGVHERWVLGRPVEDDAILAAPEIGPAADMATLYALGTGMRSVPIGKTTLVALLVPAVLPLLVAASIEVPIKEVLLKILGALA
jgi:hypothetical protein